MRWALIAVVVAVTSGCIQAFDLRSTVEAKPPDTDGDGVIDEVDNCPTNASDDASDIDGDSIGDICDNCPLVPNTDQEVTGDDDLVGDYCDPHPAADGDCLLVVDRFADPTAFTASWRIVSPETTPRVAVEPGKVTITPTPGTGGIAVVTGDERLDVVVRGRLPSLTARIDPIATVAAVTNLSAVTSGYRCELRLEDTTRGYLAVAAAPPITSPRRSLSTDPVRDTLVVRIRSTPEPSDLLRIGCRIDYGVAVGSSEFGPAPDPHEVGGAGVLTTDDPFELHAIALSRFQSGQTCEPTIFR